MSQGYSRRRFLSDLLFVGGVIAVSAGLAATAASAEMDSPTPAPSTSTTPVVKPSTTPSPRLMPMPGDTTVQGPAPGGRVPVVRPPTNPAGAPVARPVQPVPKKSTKP